MRNFILYLSIGFVFCCFGKQTNKQMDLKTEGRGKETSRRELDKEGNEKTPAKEGNEGMNG